MDKQMQNWYQSSPPQIETLRRLREAHTAFKEEREREIAHYRGYWPEMLKEYKARKVGDKQA